MTTVKLACGLIALTALASCGLKGDLERPEPIFRDAEPATTSSKPAEPAKPAQPASPAEVEDVPDDELLGGL